MNQLTAWSLHGKRLTEILKCRCEPDLDLVRLGDEAGGATVGPVERRAPGSVVGPEQRW